MMISLIEKKGYVLMTIFPYNRSCLLLAFVIHLAGMQINLKINFLMRYSGFRFLNFFENVVMM